MLGEQFARSVYSKHAQLADESAFPQCYKWFIRQHADFQFCGALPLCLLFTCLTCSKVNRFSHLDFPLTSFLHLWVPQFLKMFKAWLHLHPTFIVKILLVLPLKRRIQFLLTTTITLEKDTVTHVNIAEPPHGSPCSHLYLLFSTWGRGDYIRCYPYLTPSMAPQLCSVKAKIFKA